MANFMNLTMFEQTLNNARGQRPADPSMSLFPVPFENQFSVSFVVAGPSAVSVDLYNQLGQKVETLVDRKNYKTGTFTIPVDGSRLSSGTYIAAVTINGQVVSKKTIKLQ